MRDLWFVVALAGTGCNNLLGISGVSLTDAPPGTIDASGDVCVGSLTSVCVSSGVGETTLTGAIDTSSDSRCRVVQINSVDVCAIVGTTITVGAGGVRVSGTRPLMLAAATTITISGGLDASSRHGQPEGPGAGLGPCSAPVPGGTGFNGDGGGGGGGGTLGGAGAVGGRGNGGSAGSGGGPGGIPAITGLRGGCKGSIGGIGVVAAIATNGGDGGGAIYLTAADAINVTSTIDASGAGGDGGKSAHSGGGGGGSGGMIVLEAPRINVNGAGEIFANGGAGGEGAQIAGAGDGGESAAWDREATANNSSVDGGDGGDGATRVKVATVGANGGNKAAGGGGGGGLGVIRYRGTLTAPAVLPISPAAMTF